MSGYKVVRVILDAKGNATSWYEEFVWWWSVDVTFDWHGNPLFGDDGETVWQVRPPK